MVEVSKEIKIVLLINAIVALIYGIMYMIIPDVTNALTDGPYYNPAFYQLLVALVSRLLLFLYLHLKEVNGKALNRS